MNATKKLAAAAAAVLSAVAVSGIGAASAHADGNGPTRVLTLVEHRIQENQVDLGPAGPSVFDQLQFAGEFTSAGSVRAGTDSGICTVTAFTARRHEATCTAVAELDGGQLVATGQEDLSSTTQVFAVTGGTRQYRNATGQITINQTGPLSRRVVIDLRGSDRT